MKQIIYFLWVVSLWDLHEGKASFLLSLSAFPSKEASYLPLALPRVLRLQKRENPCSSVTQVSQSILSEHWHLSI